MFVVVVRDQSVVLIAVSVVVIYTSIRSVRRSSKITTSSCSSSSGCGNM